MNWKVIVDVAIKAAQAVPVAIALAACAVEFCEEVIAGAVEDASTNDEGEKTEMAQQVATLVRAFRRFKASIWPWSRDADVEETIDQHLNPDQPLTSNIIQFSPDG